MYSHIYLHVPHASTHIPDEAWDTFTVPKETIEHELVKMTDWFTDQLAYNTALKLPNIPLTIIRSPVSRLVVDVERFPDNTEPMNKVGMGVVYSHGHDKNLIRDPEKSYSHLIDAYYLPHGERWNTVFAQNPVTETHPALVIDLHSFPSQRLPYETGGKERPQICVGTDSFHTPVELVSKIVEGFGECGYSTALDSPFAGTYTPNPHYQNNPYLHSVMVEIRRDVYMLEETPLLVEEKAEIFTQDFADIIKTIR